MWCQELNIYLSIYIYDLSIIDRDFPYQFNLRLIAELFTVSFQFLEKKNIFKNFQKLAGLWLVGKVVNHVGIFGSKAAESLSAFQRRSCHQKCSKLMSFRSCPWSETDKFSGGLATFSGFSYHSMCKLDLNHCRTDKLFRSSLNNEFIQDERQATFFRISVTQWGNLTVIVGFPSQMARVQSFDVFIAVTWQKFQTNNQVACELRHHGTHVTSQ